MEANELRIGNYAHFKYKDEIHHETQIDSTDIMALSDNNTMKLPFGLVIKPIPLTEEWLLKFGFVEFITLDVYPTYALKKINVNNGTVYVSELGFLNHIKYVHQLQNLYFALTNEELTIKQ